MHILTYNGALQGEADCVVCARVSSVRQFVQRLIYITSDQINKKLVFMRS